MSRNAIVLSATVFIAAACATPSMAGATEPPPTFFESWREWWLDDPYSFKPKPELRIPLRHGPSVSVDRDCGLLVDQP